MKRKSLLFLMLAALFAPLAMNGQTLTVYEETTTTNEYVPFYGYYADDTQRNQMIYPASELTAMAGKEITQMVFYIDDKSGSGDIGNWIVSLGETTATTLSGLDNTSPLTEVYSGAMTFNSDETLMTVTFTNGYTYNGGNLLVQFNHPVAAGYKHYYFSGVTATGASYCYSNQRNFLPKVTFTYQAPPACPKPTGVTATNPTAHGATVSWTGSSDSYILMLGQPTSLGSYDFESNSIPAAFTNSTTYPWTVVANTHSGAYCAKSGNAGSNSSTSDLVLEVNLTSAGSVSFSAMASSENNYDWGRFLIDGAQQFQTSGTSNSWTDYSYDLAAGSHTLTWRFYKDSSTADGDDCFYVDDIKINMNPSTWDETHTASASPYTFTDLNPETSYLVMVKGICDGEPGEPSAAVSFTTLESCATPQNLTVTTDGATAIATWTGTEGTCNIDINGTVYNNVTSPYEFRVELSTTYTVKVQANCTGGTSGWSAPFSITTPPCVGGHTIEYTLNDSYGDGWNGNAINIVDECGNLIETLTIASGSSNNGTLSLCGDYYQFTWTAGGYADETSFTLTDNDNAIYSNQSGSSLTDGQVLYTIGTNTRIPRPTALTAGDPDKREVELSWTENGTATAWELCVNGDESNPVAANSNPFTLTGLTPDTDYTIKVRATNGTDVSCWTDEITFHTAIACAKPTNLAEANITYTTVDLSWIGNSDSYVAQYGTWTQVGTDHITTATLTPYTFDLSGFSGNGTVAIRHYNVTDMFRLNVDDIVVKDANNTVVYSQNFESGSIPSTMSNIDLDGDGNVWDIVGSTFNVNGSYGASSSSWLSGTALTPDNWLVISDVMLGGSITFYAAGQDASAASENFAVYVIADNQFTEAYSGEYTSCQVTGLTEGTPYVWRVKGICGEDPSNWVSSMFKTKDDLLVFATQGDWDEISNWTDADGNDVRALPTVDNKVRIDANAIIRDGVVATAKSTVLNNGAIEIEEGGQLKQGSTVKVTMHKGIIGYGAGNEEAADHYYFIATPHSCSYLEENTTFPYVLNLNAGNYDLYAFDPTSDLEWINFESSSDHSEFHTGDNYGLFNKKGYLYANEESRDLIFVGTVSSSLNNTLTDSYTYNSSSTDNFNGWRLVGNPFTCNAYINYVDGEGNVLEADFYTMNSDGDGYDLTSSSVALAPLTGALINYSATGTIQFASEEPTKAKRTGMLNMSVSRGSKNQGQARLRFGQGHNLGSMSFRKGSSKVYIPVDYNDYAVVYSEENAGEMPVNFKAAENGTFTIGFNTEDVEFSYLHLIDNMTGADVNLLQTPSYTFDARTSDYESRFRLVFATGSSANDDTFGFVNASGNFCIFGIEGEATVQVIDVLGHVLSSEQFSGSYEKHLNVAPGVYVIRLIQGNDIKVQKVVVRR